MSLHPQPIPPIPEQTARVARAAFPKENMALLISNVLGKCRSSFKFKVMK